MTGYFIAKYLHVLGAIVILGTGSGIAFFMLMAHRSGDAAFIARTAATVVVADMLFTLSAVLLQPVTGGVLMALSSTSPTEPWLADRARPLRRRGTVLGPGGLHADGNARPGAAAAASHTPLPARYFMLYRRWFLFGIPGFGSVMAILWLMIAKPGF